MTAVGETLDTRATGRQDRLASRVHQLRTRAGAGSLDRWMLIIGGIAVPLGLLLILLGWQGASHTPLLFSIEPTVWYAPPLAP